MKIIHFVGNLNNLRGLERQALIQCDALIDCGVRCQLWTLSSSAECQLIASQTKNLTIRVLAPSWLPFKEAISFLVVFFLFAFSRYAKLAKVIHLHGLSRSCLPFFVFAKLFSKRVVIKLSNSGSKSVFLKMKLLGPIARYVMNLARVTTDSWICLNQTSKQDAMNCGIDKNKLVNISNICPYSYQPAFHYFKEQSPKISIVHVGALVPHKNPQIALKVAHLLQFSPDFHFTFAGSGPMLKDLSLRCPSNVTFCGILSSHRLHELYLKSHIYLSTSAAEGMSNSLLEALAFGLIPVVSDIEANSNILGLYYPYLNPIKASNFVESIRAIARHRKNPICQNTILNNYSKSNISRLLIDLYKRL